MQVLQEPHQTAAELILQCVGWEIQLLSNHAARCGPPMPGASCEAGHSERDRDRSRVPVRGRMA